MHKNGAMIFKIVTS